jgi:CheY-like chemotaxis protein
MNTTMRVKSCLLIEDDHEDQELFIDAVHAISPRIGCYAVSNGEEALTALLQEGLIPDYIFTDLNMPRMNGFEFLKILRGIERFRTIPVIVLSSEYSQEVMQKVKDLGATAFYSKTRFELISEILKKYFLEPAGKSTVL